MKYDFLESIASEGLTDKEVVNKYGRKVADEYIIWDFYNNK